SQKIKNLIIKEKISPSLAKKVIECYLKLGGVIRQALVAIRSSATAEDLPTASFAGQQTTYLNIKGESNVVLKVKECWASFFEPRAIFYRQEKKIDHLKAGMAVLIQEMVPADVSGVMFTIDPVTNQKNRILIEAIYGLGELIVQGAISPDQYLLDKDSLEIINRHLEKQTVQLIKVGSLNRKTRVPSKLQTKRKLTDKQIVELARLGKKIHRHYFFPQDIEWVLTKNKFYIVQTRPVTTIKEVEKQKNKEAKKTKRNPILTGMAASPGMAAGPVKIIRSAKQINKIKKGDILVTLMTTPDFVPAMKKAVAIVTNSGGQTSHAAIVSRELGVPCVVGTKKATTVLKNGQLITVNGALGEIYQGGLKLSSKGITRKGKVLLTPPVRLTTLKTATKIYVNLAEPELAETTSQLNVEGIGLLRAEFMISQIGTHPKKLIKDKKEKVFVEKLTEGLAKFCSSFAPRPVVYRTTDFKTNEYRHLIGGKAFEPEEENPFLGFRGAFRYLSDPAVFELELKAIKNVRNKHNLKNLWLMIPFCRTPKELQEVKKIIVSNGLNRSPSFKLWLMVEIPANVILLKDFIKVGIDGVSIGSNDLTMLLLGVDRDNAELAGLFNELNPAVFWALKKTIKTCRQAKITSSICGQAPSIYPDLVEKLIEWGITSISVSPDAIERT
ncbi:MAG TPA: phosphoenolpyruvate synthase, partial [Nevskiaceae bacterium]|nr:phosphoenolpyruvate synthase [Nevskiaceae bacterium]